MECEYTHGFHPGATCGGQCAGCLHNTDDDKNLALAAQVAAIDVWTSLENESTDREEEDVKDEEETTPRHLPRMNLRRRPLRRRQKGWPRRRL